MVVLRTPASPRARDQGKVEYEHEPDDENDRKGTEQIWSGPLAALAIPSLMRFCSFRPAGSHAVDMRLDVCAAFPRT